MIYEQQDANLISLVCRYRALEILRNYDTGACVRFCTVISVATIDTNTLPGLHVYDGTCTGTSEYASTSGNFISSIRQYTPSLNGICKCNCNVRYRNVDSANNRQIKQKRHLFPSSLQSTIGSTDASSIVTAIVPFDVYYIELTDAYGMMYHSNYMALIERSIIQTIARHNSRLLSTEPTKTNGIFTRPRTINSMKLAKFRAAARLGDVLHVEIIAADTDLSCFDAVVYRIDEGTKEPIFSAKKVTCIHTNTPHPSAPVTSAMRHDEASIGLPYFERTYSLWPDELAGTALAVPTKTIFNIFERARTDILGK